MTRTQLMLGLVTAASIGTVYAYDSTEPAPTAATCELHTVFGPCSDLQSLPGTGLPACDDGMVGAVLAIRLTERQGPPTQLAGWVQPPGLVKTPIDCAAYDWTAGDVQVVPVETMHTESVVGMVGRHEQRTAGPDGTELVTPAVEPHIGHCYGSGCYCASDDCEHYAVGAPDGLYWCERLKRLHPEAVCE